MNVKRRNEHVATDTIYCDIPATDDGYECDQVFLGTETMLNYVHGVKSDNQFVNILEDNIRKRGKIDKLTSESAQSEIRTRLRDILRSLFVYDWQS